MSGFPLQRLGQIMETEPGNPLEIEGVLNPTAVRITSVERLQRYVRTYTAFSPIGPRIALAEWEEWFHWKRLGLATFAPYRGIEFVPVDKRDAILHSGVFNSHHRLATPVSPWEMLKIGGGTPPIARTPAARAPADHACGAPAQLPVRLPMSTGTPMRTEADG